MIQCKKCKELFKSMEEFRKHFCEKEDRNLRVEIISKSGTIKENSSYG